MDTINNNYLAFLREFYEQIRYKSCIVKTDALSHKHKVSTYSTSVLIEGGIIKVEGVQGNVRAYSWQAGLIPNIKMAEELRKKCNQKCTDWWDKKRGNKPKRKSSQTKVLTDKSPVKPTVVLKEKQERKRVRTFSLLWGAIKFNY